MFPAFPPFREPSNLEIPRESFHLLDCSNVDDDVDIAEAGRRLVAIGVRRRAIRKQLVELLAPLLEDKPTDKEKAKRLL